MESFGPPEGPNVQRAKVNPPKKPEKSPDLTLFFSERAQFNNISGPPVPFKNWYLYVVRGMGPPVSSALTI